MANGHGGYRKPTTPAPVSGPGALSKRTDGGPQSVADIAANGKYGERKAMQQMQSAAPMAGNPVPSAPITGLFNPTTRPDEPVTAGSPMGLGPGPEVLPTPQPKSVRDTLQRLAQVDDSGQVDLVLNFLNQRGV